MSNTGSDPSLTAGSAPTHEPHVPPTDVLSSSMTTAFGIEEAKATLCASETVQAESQAVVLASFKRHEIAQLASALAEVIDSDSGSVPGQFVSEYDWRVVGREYQSVKEKGQTITANLREVSPLLAELANLMGSPAKGKLAIATFSNKFGLAVVIAPVELHSKVLEIDEDEDSLTEVYSRVGGQRAIDKLYLKTELPKDQVGLLVKVNPNTTRSEDIYHAYAFGSLKPGSMALSRKLPFRVNMDTLLDDPLRGPQIVSNALQAVLNQAKDIEMPLPESLINWRKFLDHSEVEFEDALERVRRDWVGTERAERVAINPNSPSLPVELKFVLQDFGLDGSEDPAQLVFDYPIGYGPRVSISPLALTPDNARFQLAHGASWNKTWQVDAFRSVPYSRFELPRGYFRNLGRERDLFYERLFTQLWTIQRAAEQQGLAVPVKRYQ